jgi:hypothetical protein
VYSEETPQENNLFWTDLMSSKTGILNMEILIPIGVLVAWFALQAWILPRFGVST